MNKHIELTSNEFQGTQRLTFIPREKAPQDVTPTDAATVRAALGRQHITVSLIDERSGETLSLSMQRLRPSENSVFFEQVITPKVIKAIHDDIDADALRELALSEMGIENDFDIVPLFQNIKVKIVAAAMQDTELQDEAFWQDADSELLDTLFDIATGVAVETTPAEKEIAALTAQLATAETENTRLAATLAQRDTDLETVTERLQACEKENAALIEQLNRAEAIIGPPEDTLFSGDMAEEHGAVKDAK